jgi:hypothetical protein
MEETKMKMDRRSFLKMGAVFLGGLILGKLPGGERSSPPAARPRKEARYYSKKQTLAG